MAAVVIVGAGVTGLLTAVRCALAGHRVTLLEQGPIPNTGSSSFDQHRALRLDARGPTGDGLHERWLRLQAILGGRFYRGIGAVTVEPAAAAEATAAAARRAGARITLMGPEALPHIVFAPGCLGVHELDAGVLLAERVLHAAARWLRAQPGVTLRPWSPIVTVDPDHARLTVADGRMLSGDLVLVAAGVNSRELVETTARVRRQTIVYAQPPTELVTWWEHAPTVGGVGADGTGWLLPPGDGTLLKLSSAGMCRPVGDAREPLIGADFRVAQGWRALLAQPERYTVIAVKHCHYSLDPGTGAGALEQIGPAVWARAAVGGDGFRTAPLVADRIAELVATAAAA
ncbi:NAD(P)/FAD-dependent oxidoreductase [Nocardia sp. NPDC101769]|uniref:NAD(P)/FAD-dependent oxidoreductase n=1 Tax=Nocardia sp. NPDC101769 TaxID=3364333 RepID=UPI0037FC4C26